MRAIQKVFGGNYTWIRYCRWKDMGYIVFVFSVIVCVCLFVCVLTFFVWSKISQELLHLGFWNLVQMLGITDVLCKSESASSCISFLLFVHFTFSPIKTSVTDFSASMRAKVFKFCIQLEIGQVYCGKDNQDAEINFCLLFPFFHL